MGRKNGQPTPDLRPPAQNPHYNSYGQPPPPYQQNPPQYQQPPYQQPPPPQQHRAQPPPPQQHRAQPQRGGGGGHHGAPQTRGFSRPNPPSEVSDCVKYSLFLYNVIFWVVGLLFVAAGVWALNDRGAFNQIKSNSLEGFSFLTDPVLWLFFLGAVIFLLGTMGCLGALRENICMLKTFSIVMGLILLLEIGGGFAVYFYREQIEGEVTRAVTEVTIRDYRENADFQDLIDAVQSGLSCCGGESIDDWDKNIYFNCSGPPNNPERCGVPFSCCLPDDFGGVANTQCGYNVRDPSNEDSISSKIYTQGCVTAFRTWFNTYLYYVAGVAGVIILVQLFGFCFAHSLINDIKRQKARWARR